MADTRYYVKRTRTGVSHAFAYEGAPPDKRIGHVAWTGPLRGRTRAEREAAAWAATGHWTTEVHRTSPETRRQVRAWEAARS